MHIKNVDENKKFYTDEEIFNPWLNYAGWNGFVVILLSLLKIFYQLIVFY